MGYETASDNQIIKYLPLVEKVVKRIEIKSREYEYQDLYNLGVIGLMDALKKYDPSKKVPFESYAYIRIKGAVIDEVRKTARVSRNRLAELNNYYQAKEFLEKQWLRSPTEKEICGYLNIDSKQLGKIYDTVHYLGNVSLEEMIFNQSGDGLELQDVIEDQRIADADEVLLLNERKTALLASIKELKEREQLILDLYYVQELGLKDIAEILEISLPRVSQIHGKILINLKQLVEEKLK